MTKSDDDEFAGLTLDDPPAEYLAAIGLVSARYSKVELSLIAILQQLTNTDPAINMAVTAHMTSPQRIDAFLTLTKMRFHQNLPLIHEAELLAEHYGVRAKERAQVIHPIWLLDPATGNVHRSLTSARGQFVSSFDQHPIDKVRALADEISALIERITRFHLAAFGVTGLPPESANKPNVAGLIQEMRDQIVAQYAEVMAREDVAVQNKARKKAHAETSRNHPRNRPKGKK